MIKTILSILFLMGCQITKPDPDKYYRKSMDLTVNGVSGRGMLVAPLSDEGYLIEGGFDAAINYLEIESCHRYDLLEHSDDEFVYEYNQNDFERSGLCYVLITGLSNTGFHSWGLIEFKNDKENLDADVFCNGQLTKTAGVSVCQSKVGKTQAIRFGEKVRVRSTCNTATKTKDQMTYVYDIQEGLCSYLFTVSGNVHRLTTFGYDEVLLKGH